jgi:acylphosphatase
MATFRYHVVVRGLVQGISYRYFVSRKAAKAGITGSVKNLTDGGVDIIAEGGEEQLDAFMAAIKSGHPWARIDEIETEKEVIETGSHTGFNIEM